jgi:hypothetical protein
VRPWTAAHAFVCAVLGGSFLACGSKATPAAAADAGDDDAAATVTPLPDASAGGFRVCWRLDDAPDCFACCLAYFPIAQEKLLAAAAACTCGSSVCGPPNGYGRDAGPAVDAGDGGGPDGSEDAGAAEDAGDAADAGAGACSAAMCSLGAPPSQSCLQCVLGVIEGAAGPPSCAESNAACNLDPDCAPLLQCAQNCPGTAMD